MERFSEIKSPFIWELLGLAHTCNFSHTNALQPVSEVASTENSVLHIMRLIDRATEKCEPALRVEESSSPKL